MDKKDLWFPNNIMNRDERFNVQKWLEYHKVWLANEYYANKRCSYWIEEASKKTGVTSKAILISMAYEHSALEGVTDGKTYFYPSGEKRELKRVKNMICGVSGGSVKSSRKYAGFKKQVFMCAEILAREMKEYKKGMTATIYIGKKRKAQEIKPLTSSAYAMFVYSPYPCKVKKMKQLWKKYFPEDF